MGHALVPCKPIAIKDPRSMKGILEGLALPYSHDQAALLCAGANNDLFATTLAKVAIVPRTRLTSYCQIFFVGNSLILKALILITTGVPVVLPRSGRFIKGIGFSYCFRFTISACRNQIGSSGKILGGTASSCTSRPGPPVSSSMSFWTTSRSPMMKQQNGPMGQEGVLELAGESRAEMAGSKHK